MLTGEGGKAWPWKTDFCVRRATSLLIALSMTCRICMGPDSTVCWCFPFCNSLKYLLIHCTIIIIVCTHLCMRGCVGVHVSWCTREGLRPLCGVNSLSLSCHLYLGSGGQTQVLIFARKLIYPLSHPTSLSLLISTLPNVNNNNRMGFGIKTHENETRSKREAFFFVLV